jgi:quercetin dioxygenase-like cupin family protein
MITDTNCLEPFRPLDGVRPRIFFGRNEMLNSRVARSERFQIHGDIVTLFAGAEDTNGAWRFFQTDILARHASGVLPHAHLREDETSLVRRGLFEFLIAGRRIVLRPRHVVWILRGIVHSYRSLNDGVGTLWAALSPAGLEGLFREAGIRLDVSLPGLDREVAKEFIHPAHEICLYSKAMRGNIVVETNLV